MKHQCETCGKLFTHKPWTYAYGKNTYCSDECRHISMKPESIEGCTALICEHCKRSFSHAPAVVNGLANFCCFDCKCAFVKENLEENQETKEDQKAEEADINHPSTYKPFTWSSLTHAEKKWLSHCYRTHLDKTKDAQVNETHDTINHPKHYKQHPSGIECIQITQHMSFTLGNVIKYVWRSDHKNGLEDLKKAQWYLSQEIKLREQKEL